MYNWNTDTTKFKTKEDQRVWEIIQLLEYGSAGHETLKKEELISLWSKIEPHIDPATKRLLEYLLWDKVSSLPINNNFWIQSSPLLKL